MEQQNLVTLTDGFGQLYPIHSVQNALTVKTPDLMFRDGRKYYGKTSFIRYRTEQRAK